MVLHASAYAAPHSLVWLAIHLVVLRTEWREIDVAASFRILSGENVVPHGSFVEVSILGIVSAVEEVLRELQHVICVAALRTIKFFNVCIAILS